MTSSAPVSSPLISVVLPVYNGSDFLAAAIDSILKQTISDFELIIIDDGSTDNSLAILHYYEERDPRIKVITRANKGLANTLNESLTLATGEWIARMDQDDIALPLRFEKQLAYLRSSGADIVGSWVKRFGAADNRIVRLPESDNAIKMEMLFLSPFAHPTVMMRAALVKQLRYEHKWDKAEDYDLWVRAAIAGWKMGNVPEVLLLYRVHAAQISTAASNRQLKLSQGIRKAYWNYIFNLWNIDKSCIDSVLNSRVTGLKADINEIEKAMTEVLRNCQESSREVVLSHALRIYYRMAADCPDIVSRWKKLSNEFAEGASLKSRLMLGGLRFFRVKPEGNFFIGIRAILIFLQAR